MKADKFQELSIRHFPASDFFAHLKKGTEFYQKRDYGRAIEEFTEADLLFPPDPVKVAVVNDKISFKGKIKEVPFLFFQSIIQSGKLSGVGLLQFQDMKRKFIFMNGNLIHTISADQKDRIGNYLVRRKLMAPEELDQHALESRKRKRKIGSWLVLNKMINEMTLKELLAIQTTEIFSNCLFWEDGYFFFMEMKVNEPPSINHPPLKMALSSSVRGFHFKDFRKEIPNNKIIFKPAPHAVKNKEQILKKLDTNDQFIFFLVDGTRNIDQLIQFSGNDEMTVINILYKLCSLGLVRKTKEIREYEDKVFNEVRMILGVLFDIYFIVSKELNEELGNHGKEIINKVQSLLPVEHAAIFSNIALENQEEMKLNTIFKNISFNFPYPQKRFLFIDAFLEVFRNSLTELNKFLGIGLRKKTIEQMKLIIENLERFSINTDLKSYMVKNLKQLIT